MFLDDRKKEKVSVTKEWLDEALSEIKKLAPEDTGMHYSFRDSGYSSTREYSFWEHTVEARTFQELLLSEITKRGMSYIEFYTNAHMDRKLFSAIKNNPEYQPKKETAAACCLGLRMNWEDAEILLSCAGYKLSLSIPFDRVIYYCLHHGITDIDVVNELLYETGAKCIGI